MYTLTVKWPISSTNLILGCECLPEALPYISYTGPRASHDMVFRPCAHNRVYDFMCLSKTGSEPVLNRVWLQDCFVQYLTTLDVRLLPILKTLLAFP